MDPVNAEPGWSNEDIVEELKSMIEVNSVVAATARWNTLELPQHIDPEKLPYVRRGGPRPSRDPYVKTERSATLESEAPKTYPEAFYAPSSTPQSLFKHQDREFFVAHRDYRELLVFTDGPCSHNGHKGAQGGCAFVFRCGDGIPRPWDPPKGAYLMHGTFFFRLEDVGPSGKPERPTSNRAELRAVVAALGHFRTDTTETGLKFWEPRDSAKLVIATDSTYVVEGATKWCRSWEMNGWKKSDGAPVMNKDL
jgi:ribonuclease HI